MNRTIKLVVVGGLMAAGLVQTYGQNIVQNININLKGVAQGVSAVPIKVTNKDILALIGLAVETDLTGAKLLLVTSGEGSSVVARPKEGEDIDVSEFLSKAQISDAVVTDNSSETKTDITTYSINQFVFDAGDNANFDVQGYTTERTRNIVSNGETIGEATDTKSTVAGTGTVVDQFAVLQGTVQVTGRKVETPPGE
jgi:hypothetical protein